MEIWTDAAYQQITDRCSRDREYQNALAECREKERRYDSTLAQLTDQQRSAIDDYIAACEELEFQFARVAFCCALELKKEETLQA